MTMEWTIDNGQTMDKPTLATNAYLTLRQATNNNTTEHSGSNICV